MDNLLKKFGLKGKEKADDDDDDQKRYVGLWSKDLARYKYGEYSYAVWSDKVERQDYSEFSLCPIVTYAGIYAGHEGYHAGFFVSNSLVNAIIHESSSVLGAVGEGSITRGFAEVEAGFLGFARSHHSKTDDICRAGCAALVAIMYGGDLILANLGNSRALMGLSKKKVFGGFKTVADQITTDHVPSRSIGDLIRKDPIIAEYHRQHDDPPQQQFHQEEPPISVPELRRIKIEPNHKFLVLGSHGLWDVLSNKRVLELVLKYPKDGIAKRIAQEAIDAATEVAAKKLDNVASGPLLEEGGKVRISLYDDISVIVLFFDLKIQRKDECQDDFEVKPYRNTCEQSPFGRFFGQRVVHLPPVCTRTSDGASTSTSAPPGKK